jgi:hypothetical protein
LINPGQTEVCDDGLDNDCDSATPDVCSTDYTGLWTLDSTVSYSCVFGIVSLSFSTVSVFDASPALQISAPGGSQPGTMSGTINVASDFSVTNVLPGACIETYTMVGSFTDTDTFTAAMSATFTGGPGACWDCTNQSWTISGTR